MKTLTKLILLILFAGLMQGCTSNADSFNGKDARLAPVFMPCVWWTPNECRCRGSHKIIYTTSSTDFSKMYQYCRTSWN